MKSYRAPPAGEMGVQGEWPGVQCRDCPSPSTVKSGRVGEGVGRYRR